MKESTARRRYNEASISNVLRGKARSAKGWIFEVLDKELADA